MTVNFFLFYWFINIPNVFFLCNLFLVNHIEMSHYYNLKIQNVVEETEEASTFFFQQRTDKMLYKPGQFLTLILKVEHQALKRAF